MSTALQRSCHLCLQGRLQSRTVHFHQAELGLVQLSSLFKTGVFCWFVSFVYFLFLFYFFWCVPFVKSVINVLRRHHFHKADLGF